MALKASAQINSNKPEPNERNAKVKAFIGELPAFLGTELLAGYFLYPRGSWEKSVCHREGGGTEVVALWNAPPPRAS